MVLAYTLSWSCWLPLVPTDSVVRRGLGWALGPPDLGLALTFLLALVVNGFGEVTGWRGYLADGLLDRRSLLRRAGPVAVVWAGWHLPLFVVLDSFRGLGFAVVGWMVGLYAGSIEPTWLYVASGRSILVVAPWHTADNFTSATSAMNGLPAAVVVVILLENGPWARALGPSRSRTGPQTMEAWSRDGTGS